MPVIINTGVPGNTSGEIRARLARDVLAHGPDLVVVKAGTNDALNSAKLVPPAETAANLAAIADAVRARCRLLLVTQLPFHEPYLLARHRPEAYGALPPAERLRLARAAVHAIGAPVADAWSAFQGAGMVGEDPRSLLRNLANAGAADGVHPTSDGYRLLAAVVATAIRAHALPTGRIVCVGDSITFGQYVPGEGAADGESYPGWLGRILAA